MRLIWSFRHGKLALLEDAPLEGDSDFGCRPPVYLAVKGCRASAAIPGIYQYDELIERSDNLLVVWNRLESAWEGSMRRKIGDELERQGRDRYTGQKKGGEKKPCSPKKSPSN